MKDVMRHVQALPSEAASSSKWDLETQFLRHRKHSDSIMITYQSFDEV
jgi:hypothetical protein